MKHAVMTTALAAIVAVLATIADGECAQGTAGPPDALRQQLEQRFDVTALQDGVLLRPIRGDARFRAIEVNERSIAIDGVAATGAELRSRLGADADVVLRLSYLDADARRQLLGSPSTRCAMMLRWISDVPPAMVPEKLRAYRSNQLAK